MQIESIIILVIEIEIVIVIVMNHYYNLMIFKNPHLWEGQTHKIYFINEHSAHKSAQLSVKAF